MNVSLRTRRSAGATIFLALVALLVGGLPDAAAQQPMAVDAATGEQPLAYLEELPPLLDREIFFSDPEIGYAALSPDGEHIAFVQQLDGVPNVWVRGFDEPFEAATPVTHDRNRPVIGYFWSADGSAILWSQDVGGNENFRIYAVDPTADPAPGEKVPSPRDLTPYENIQARIYAVPKATPEWILVGINDRDPRIHDVYRLNIETGERELVQENPGDIAGWMADLDGNLRLASRVTENGGTEILRVDGEELISVYKCEPAETISPMRFHPDGERVWMSTNCGEDVDLARLVLFDPETGEMEVVESDPEGEVDFGGAIFSEVDDRLLATTYTGDRVRIYPKDPVFEKDVERLREAGLDGDLFFRTPTRDDRIWIVKNIVDVDEGPNYLYDRETGEVELLYRPQPWIPTEHMAPMEPVRYTARDGETIPAYLTLPKGVEPKNLAVVVMPHGGPWGRDAWGFNENAQFLANRGYAVLQPNFRSSAGFGKRFLALGDRTWGTGSMQHDITDGAKWLVEKGIADPDRIAIMGGSYGGYATLAGVAFTPELYAAGVDIVGPSNIITLLNTIPPYWEPLVAMWHERVGDPSDPEDRTRLEAQSPLNSATEIVAPLLVIQGANDPRVKKSESDQIVAALHDLGRDVEYLVAPDEGHGFAGELNNLAMYASIERFLARHLGGRYQADMRPEIDERLQALTVDPGTVEAPATAEQAGGR